VLTPAAILVLVSGMAISARVYYSAKRFQPGYAVLSAYESREENPEGYLIAAASTLLACGLLFPAALVFRRVLRGSWWSASGACIYGAGCASGMAMAALEPFLNLFHPLHVTLAFMTFLGMVGGLGCVSVAAARIRLWPGRGAWAAAAAIHCVACLLALEVIPLPKGGSTGFWDSLAAGELGLAALIGAGTAALAAACARAEPRV